MDLGLEGKHAFVSGASSGIGRAIAIELAKEGCAVAIHGRDEARIAETVEAVERVGARGIPTAGDLSTDAGCAHVADIALSSLGRVDIVINNAGAAAHMDNPLWSALTPQDYIDSFQTNFLSSFRMTQHFLPGIRAGGWGRVINISSGVSLTAGLLPDYGAAKAALNKLTADMAKELGNYGATANGILPGIILTPAIDKYLGELKKKRGWTGDQAEIERRYFTEVAPQSVKRMGRPEDIAKVVTFLASEAASYITGMTMRVGGGSGTSVYY